MTTHRRLAAALVLGAIGTAALAAPPKPIELPGGTVRLKSSNLPGYLIAQQKCAICHSADYIAYQPPMMTVAQWTGEMAKMKKLYGAPIDDDETKLLGIYLAATYGDARSVAPADRAATLASLKAAAAPATATAGSGAAPPVASAGSGAGAAPASGTAIDVQALLGANACLGCHAVATQIVGPAYRDVAARYKGDPNAVAKLEASIKGGGAGKWGSVPMPPFPQLSAPQLKALAEYVAKQ